MFDVEMAKILPMTAGTGTGWPRSRGVQTEYFRHPDNFNLQRGAFAYLDWSYVFSEIRVTLLHADCVNFGNSIAYLHLGLRDPNLEL